MRELLSKDLAAKSPRGATYSVRLFALAEGFAVETCRGAGGKIQGREIYWRSNEGEARKLVDSIIAKKTAKTPSRPRVYETTVESQSRLFS